MLKQLTYLGLFCLLFSCTTLKNGHKREVSEPQQLLLYEGHPDQPTLKAHLRNGDVVLFARGWEYQADSNLLKGPATRYDLHRTQTEQGSLSLALDSIVLLESTARLKDRLEQKIGVLTLLTIANVGLTAFCVTNPKACFGSCPTFYLDKDAQTHYSNAEGFSSAILPSIEYGDIDDLNAIHEGGSFTLYMRNEAAERHVVNQVHLLSLPLESGRKYFHAPATKRFYSASREHSFSSCSKNTLAPLLKHRDKEEWKGKTNANSLTDKEELEFTFKNVPEGKHGLVLDYRQSFVTTFLFYKIFDLMGEDAGKLLAQMERDPDTRKKFYNILDHLGNIELSYFDEANGRYVPFGHFNENGPIAINTQLQPLPEEAAGQDSVKIKLRYSKGLWRFDAVRMALNIREAIPERIDPLSVVKNETPDSTHHAALLRDDDAYLLCDAGDKTTLHFDLPQGKQQLFLYSKGYYTEYLRQDWQEDKNLLRLARVTALEPFAWRSLAREFKEMEASYETDFFQSKFTSKPKL